MDEVLDYLKTWVPGHNIFESTAEGLGGAFAGLVSQRPVEFAAAAELLKGFDPTYVRSLFASLAGVLKQGEKWDWRHVLELAKWALAQGREIPGRKGGFMDADPDWGWTRDAVIELVSAGLEGGPDRLPLEHRASSLHLPWKWTW